MEKQNEPKIQGCEKISGGRGISATFYQWSITLLACKLVPRRYDKRSPQIFQLPDPANFFKAGVSSQIWCLIPKYILIVMNLKTLQITHKVSCRSNSLLPYYLSCET